MLVRFKFNLLFLCFIQGSLLSESSLKERVAMIPIEDKVELRDFFRGMCNKGEFLEVLLGGKPSALFVFDWWLEAVKNPRVVQENFLSYRGYKVWKKYEHLFPNQQYVWIDDKENRYFFRRWFVKKSSVKKVKDFIRFPNSSVKIRRELGIVLGYPKEDVALFYKMQRLQNTLMFFPYDSKLAGAKRRTITEVSDLYNNIKLDPIIELSEFQKNNYPIQFYTSEGPFFATDVYHRFTNASKPIEKRHAWKMKIANLYNSENFLEDILTILEEGE